MDPAKVVTVLAALLHRPRVLAQFSFWGNEKPLDPALKTSYLQDLGLEGPPGALEGALPEAENIHVPAVGMARDGPRIYLVDWKGRLWGLMSDLGPDAPSLRCFMRP